jgi:acetyl-CoA carboxylase biotin carboxyl carrier protein
MKNIRFGPLACARDARQGAVTADGGKRAKFRLLDLPGKTALPKPLTRRDAPVDLNDIEAIIDLMRKNDLSVFEMEKEGFKLRLQKAADGQPVLAAPIAIAAPAAAAPTASETAAAQKAAQASALRDIISPMVGTFYRAASPEAASFVEVGKTVNEDTVVGIIEAMKVMNEIKAEISGVIAEVVAENAKPVQFGQALFRVR